jgi:hypothetical protein
MNILSRFARLISLAGHKVPLKLRFKQTKFASKFTLIGFHRNPANVIGRTLVRENDKVILFKLAGILLPTVA